MSCKGHDANCNCDGSCMENNGGSLVRYVLTTSCLKQPIEILSGTIITPENIERFLTREAYYLDEHYNKLLVG